MYTFVLMETPANGKQRGNLAIRVERELRRLGKWHLKGQVTVTQEEEVTLSPALWKLPFLPGTHYADFSKLYTHGISDGKLILERVPLSE